MRKFLKNIACFGMLLLFAVTTVQLGISFKIKYKNLRANDNLEQTSNVNADLVLIGSSRAWAHFDPAFFDSIFQVKAVNIGVSGHSEIPLAVIRLKNYLESNKPPKFAIFNFDPFASADFGNTKDNFVLKNDYARYAFLPEAKDVPLLDYFKFTTAEKYVPLYAIFKYKLLEDCIFPKKENYYTRYGYEKNDENWDTIAKPVTAVMKKHFFKETEVPEITKALSELKTLCDEKNIHLLCIQTPVYKVVYNKEVFSGTKNIAAKLQIPFVDANVAYIRNDIRFFYNSNHLNTKGVNALNGLLEKDSLVRKFFKTNANL